MKQTFLKILFLTLMLAGLADVAVAQKKGGTRKSTKRTTKTKTNAKIQSSAPSADTVAVAAVQDTAAVSDSLPIKTVKKSRRRDSAVDEAVLKDRTPLDYENLRADDAVWRHKVWREIDTREKINMPFNYAAEEDNGSQRFIMILLQAIQDSLVTVFNSIDDRFTTPMTKGEVAKAVGGDPIDIPIIDSNGVTTGMKKVQPEINLDSFYKFRIKEEVIFDKESSRLFWRILGIAPVKNVITSLGIDLGPTELFWVYYPDMRPIFSKYEVYNGKNFGARMTWDDLFESRMFNGRIIKSTMDNPYDLQIRNIPGMQDNGILQLFEGENIKEKIFNYEQDLWSY